MKGKHSMNPDNPHGVLRLTQPADLPAVIAYGLGYHPSPGSLAYLALTKDGLSVIGAMDATRIPADGFSMAIDYMSLSAARNRWRICLLAYGTEDEVLERANEMLLVLESHSVAVQIATRLDQARLHCLLCDRCEVSDADLSASAVAAELVYRGRFAEPDRDAYARRLAPVAEPLRQTMNEAAERAVQRLNLLAGADGYNSQAVVDAGITAVGDAHDCAPDPLDDDTAAWLLLLLQHTTVRDHAWRTTTLTADHIALWIDLVRRTPDELRAAPACLLAAAAIAHGDGPLATTALDLADAADPDYTMSDLMRKILLAGISPDEYRHILLENIDPASSDAASVAQPPAQASS
jgi:Domain of unknown function (DUF4192)